MLIKKVKKFHFFCYFWQISFKNGILIAKGKLGELSQTISDGITVKIEGETINVGTERAISVKDLVSIMSKILSKSVKISVDDSRLRPFDVNVLECDYSKAKNLLKWSPEISLEDGLKITIDWVKNNGIKLQDPFTGFRSPYRIN